VGQRAVGPVGEDLLSLGVAAVLLFGLQHGERRVGEQGVVAPGGEQLALPGRCRGVEVADAADDQPGGDRLPLREVNAVYCVSATSAPETQQRS
jgi:hypothetical protein